MSVHLKKKVFILLFGMIFVFACNIGTPTSAEPAFDATKAVLELEATQMVLQLTQAALDNQSTPAATPTLAPAPRTTLLPPAEQMPSSTPAMSEDFETWIKSANILLYEDMAGSTDRRRYINQALNGLGLRYTDVADALGRYKSEILSTPGGKGWDLIISGKELREGVQGEFYEYLSTAINNGSAVIIEEWDMDGIINGKLSLITSKCGVSFQKDWLGKVMEDQLIFPIDDSSPILHTPNDGIALTNPTNYWLWTDLGDKMRLSSGSNAVPLWGLYPNTRNSELTAVSCVDGRVILQTYSTHSYGEDRVTRMWQNYIYNTLKARYDYLAAQ